MKRMILILPVALAILSVIVLSGTLRTRRLIRIGTALAHAAVRYEQSGEEPRILVIGDSTAVGTGASTSSKSVAGLVGGLYPKAMIRNRGINGAKVADAIKQLRDESEKNWDVVIIHIGGNDTLRFTDLNTLRADFRELLALAKTYGKEVIHISTGSLGTAKLLPWSTRWIFTLRTRQTRSIFLEEGAQASIHSIDLFREPSNDPFAQEPETYYAADLFHPGDRGYADWFVKIRPVLENVFSS